MSAEEQPAGRAKACSYLLVRYVPDLRRDEALNLGVLLHSPEEKYLGCLFTQDFRAIRRLHPGADVRLLRELPEYFEQQIDEHEDDLAGYLRSLQESLSNLIQVTDPRPCLLADPQSQIQELFARYVGSPGRATGTSRDTRLWIKQQLRTAFVRAGVWDHLERRIAASAWTQPGDRFAFDYGYRPLVMDGRPNGHIHFIHALSLRYGTDLAKVLVYTLERVRRREPADLTAVTEDAPAQSDRSLAHTRSVLEEAGVALLPVSDAEAYAERVRHELGL
jgi:hypothetical protein